MKREKVYNMRVENINHNLPHVILKSFHNRIIDKYFFIFIKNIMAASEYNLLKSPRLRQDLLFSFHMRLIKLSRLELIPIKFCYNYTTTMIR